MFLFRQSAKRVGKSFLSNRSIGSYSNKGNGLKPKSNSLWRGRFVPALVFGLAGGFGFGMYFNYTKKHARVGNESVPQSHYSVNLQPPTDAASFPPTISVNREIFQALGTGVRTVTFLSFHVYAVGLYIAADDVHMARDVIAGLKSTYNPTNDPAEWQRALQGPESGTEIVNALLKKNVRFAVRIVPVRNTDFNHLRDGFVRGITNYPEFKKVQSAEVGQSMGEIKRAFGRKRKLKKGEVITWSRDISGGMTAWYGDTDEHKELLGSPADPDVSRIFFLQYMSGSKPNSPTLKSTAVDGLVGLLT